MIDTFHRTRLTEKVLRALSQLPADHGERWVLVTAVHSDWQHLSVVQLTGVSSTFAGDTTIRFKTVTGADSWATLSEARFYRREERL